MDEAARHAAENNLVRDSDAVRETIEIVREKQFGDLVSVLARWTDSQTGRLRRGGIDVVRAEDRWRAQGGWSSNADHDADHPVWRAWGGTSRSMSGWVSDPAIVRVRFHSPQGRIQEDTVENGVAILIHETAFDRDSLVEGLDEDGNVLHTAVLA